MRIEIFNQGHYQYENCDSLESYKIRMIDLGAKAFKQFSKKGLENLEIRSSENEFVIIGKFKEVLYSVRKAND